MSNWVWILIACVTAYLTKLAGYFLPKKLLDDERVPAIAGAMTVGLLTALTVTNSLSDGQAIVFDSRLLALGAAIVALRCKAPFIVVVIVGAVVAALGRLVGLP